MPEGLYESLTGFMDAFEVAYTTFKGDAEKAAKLKGILDRATAELKEKEV